MRAESWFRCDQMTGEREEITDQERTRARSPKDLIVCAASDLKDPITCQGSVKLSIVANENVIAPICGRYHHHITLHIISYHIISYHIISYRIVSYRIVSYRIVSYRIVSYRIVSYRIVSYRIVHIVSACVEVLVMLVDPNRVKLRMLSSSSWLLSPQGKGMREMYPHLSNSSQTCTRKSHETRAQLQERVARLVAADEGQGERLTGSEAIGAGAVVVDDTGRRSERTRGARVADVTVAMTSLPLEGVGGAGLAAEVQLRVDVAGEAVVDVGDTPEGGGERVGQGHAHFVDLARRVDG
eukprot:765115-Hanusia_phi.AAC.2